MTQTILLVEDNASDERLALVAFKRCDVPHEIVVVRDGAEALDFLFGTGAHAARDTAVLPRVVLLDLQLPRVSGIDVLRRLRAEPRTRLLPVVMLTGSREEEDVRSCLAAGANAYLRKPVDFSEFIELAETTARFWLRMNERAHSAP
jgi:two-component system response regulator